MASITLTGNAKTTGYKERTYLECTYIQQADSYKFSFTAYFKATSVAIPSGKAIREVVTIDDSAAYTKNMANGSPAIATNSSAKIGTGTYTVPRKVTAKTITVGVSGYIAESISESNPVSSASTTVTIAALASYNVTYNANGGSGAPSTQQKYYNVALTLSSSTPSRTGYTFQGWNTKSDGTGTSYSAGGTYTANGAVTLYAKWKANTYKVGYDANGGSGAPSAQTKTYGVNLTLSTTKPSRTGYTFNGWNTNSSGTGTNYSAGGTYTANAAVTLYAKWQINTYSVTFDANGGSGAPSAQTKTYGTNLTLSSTRPTRTGYTFSTWNTKADGSGTNYAPGSPYQINAALKLYAKWTINTWTVSYNANGGSGAPSSQTKTYGKSLTLSSTSPTRTGYTFKTWNTNSSGTGTNYAPGATYTANAAATLYAIWQINTWQVKYNANGGSGAPSAQTKTYGTTLTLSSTKPTRNDYAFKKWNTNSNGTGTDYAPGASYTANAAATLYAIWESTYTAPKITNLTARRVSAVDGSYVDDPEGTTGQVIFNWTPGSDPNGAVNPTAIKVGYKEKSESSYHYTNLSGISSTTITAIIGENVIDIETAYDIAVVLTPSGTGRTDITRTTYISISKFIIDINASGNGIAFGRQAPENLDGMLIGMPLHIDLGENNGADPVAYREYSKRLPNWNNPSGGDMTTRPTSADINSDNSGSVINFLSTNSMTTGRPSGDGNILHFNWDNSNKWASQLFVKHSSGGGVIQHRTQSYNNGTTWTEWHDVYYAPQAIADNADLDTFTIPGDFYASTNAKAQTLQNCPTDMAFWLYVRDATNPESLDGSSYKYRTQTLVTRTGLKYVRSAATGDGGANWTWSSSWSHGIPYSTSTATAASAISGFDRHSCNLFKIGNTVFMEMEISIYSGSDTIPSSHATLFTIPSGYRPAAQKSIPCVMIRGTSSTAIVGVLRITTAGVVSQNSTSIGTSMYCFTMWRTV